MTPVELISTSSARTPSSAEAAIPIRLALRIPVSPVPTLLTLLLTTIALNRPLAISSRPTITGAPGKRFRVNTAAAAAGTLETNTERSRAAGFNPQFLLAQLNPFGKIGRAWNSMYGSDESDRDTGTESCG